MNIQYPDYDSYRPDQVLPLKQAGKYADCEVFLPAQPKPDSELLIGLLHGWLGAGTLRAVARELTHQGHSVFTVNHNRWRQSHRSKAVHEATKMAAQASGNRDVLYVGHSLAARDILSAALYQKEREELSYVITKLVTVDGVGTNGTRINLFSLPGEVQGHVELLKRAPRTYAEVVGKSAMNFLRNPPGHLLEGVSTLAVDEEKTIAALEQAGLPVERHFHLSDYVIRDPQDGRGESHEGSHLTFTVLPDDAAAIARAA